MVITRTQNYDQEHGAEEYQAGVPALESLEDRRRRWARLLRSHHYQPVIEDVLNEELPKYENSVVIDTADRISLMRECALILASASFIFIAAVEGNLVQQILTDADLQKDYAALQERAHHQPSIYVHFLADERGVAPTPNQYLIICSAVLDYITENGWDELAWSLDNISHPQVTKEASAQGHRKYLHTSSRSGRRVATLQRFCQGAQTRWLETHPALHDTPFSFAPSECGYAKDSHVRLAQHQAHKSSNYVMNLVEDICTYLHDTGVFDQHFHMHQFIIYLIFRPSQAAVAEILCSSLLQVWIENGGGFNAYPAGRSVATAQKVSAGEWAEHEQWTIQTSLVMENMGLLQEKAKEWRKVLEETEESSEEHEETERSADGGDDRLSVTS